MRVLFFLAKHLNLIIALLLSGMWLSLHVRGVWQYTFTSVLFPLLWFIVAAAGDDYWSSKVYWGEK